MTAGDESWRIFCAIAFPKEVSTRAAEQVKILRDRFPETSASWVRDGNFHLTIKFLGEVPRSQVENISNAARRATDGLTSFKLVASGAGSFPRSGPAKVLWLGVEDPTGRLEMLHQRLEEECAKEGYVKEDRSFHPHLTLARLRRSTGARELATAHRELGFKAIEMAVSELLVIRSELSSSGSKYTVISRHPL